MEYKTAWGVFIGTPEEYEEFNAEMRRRALKEVVTQPEKKKAKSSS